MRDLFPGYYPRSDADLRALWQRAAIVLDANVLLNLYRYSPTTKRALARVLGKLRERLWVPYQSAHEFHANRLGVIAKQTEAYESAAKATSDLLETLVSPRAHPFVADDVMEATSNALQNLLKDLEDRRKKYESLLHDDPDLNRLASLFHGRIGKEPSASERDALLKTAKERFELKQPPGYRDQDKEGHRRYGDAILWLQTLEYAASRKTSVILVTDDSKEDWWLAIRGQTIGPRPEMVKEFRARTNQDFHLYQPSKFVEFAAIHIGETADKSVLEEVSYMTKQRASVQERRRRRLTDAEKFYRDLGIHLSQHVPEISEFLKHVNSIPHERWKTVRHPLELPSNVLQGIQECVQKCPCVLALADEIGHIPAPGYHAVANQLTSLMPLESIELLTALRRMPDQAALVARALGAPPARSPSPDPGERSSSP